MHLMLVSASRPPEVAAIYECFFLSPFPSTSLPDTELPKCVGWEKNEKNKLVPKMVNLSASMDPVRYEVKVQSSVIMQ